MYSLPTITHNANFWATPVKIQRSAANSTPGDIINAVCFAFGIIKCTLLSKCRKWDLVYPRFICMYIMESDLKMIPKEIGKHLMLERTTVMHGVAAIKDDLNNPAYRDKILLDIIKVKNLL